MANIKKNLQSLLPIIPAAERREIEYAISRYKEVGSSLITFGQVFSIWDEKIKSHYAQASITGTQDARRDFCRFFLANEKDLIDYAFKTAKDLQPGVADKESLLEGLQASAPNMSSRTIFSDILEALSSMRSKVSKKTESVEAATGASAMLTVYLLASEHWLLFALGVVATGVLGYCASRLAGIKNRIGKYLAEHNVNLKSFDKTIGLIKKAIESKQGGMYTRVSLMNQEALRVYLSCEAENIMPAEKSAATTAALAINEAQEGGSRVIDVRHLGAKNDTRVN